MVLVHDYVYIFQVLTWKLGAIVTCLPGSHEVIQISGFPNSHMSTGLRIPSISLRYITVIFILVELQYAVARVDFCTAGEIYSATLQSC